ncbi:MAG TPA: M1 family metallopeptidase [Rhodanobacteraceae bacterium]
MQQSPSASAPVSASATRDPHSHARPDQVVVTHVALDLALDFAQQALSGHATLDLDWTDKHAGTLLLDTDELTIDAVEAVAADGNTRTLPFVLGQPEGYLCRKLTIDAADQPARVRITYRTAPTASGLQWLSPEQTADKTHPFMFSQSEATHARSWVPLQDSPAIRFTWEARIRVPDGIRAIMSANNDAAHPAGGEFTFDQPHPVPSYLLAIAAGSIDVVATGPRSAVYAEPSVIERAAREFEDTEKMIDTTEALYGPYPWGRYDILVLPPSFPYGGMENPCMTFATPTVLVGDKSLVSLVAHELAHSWSGNLVTAARWRDIWLNEGVTTYVQGRITEALYGARQADEETLLNTHSITHAMQGMEPNAQRLAPKPRDVAADDTLSRVAYDKGSWFFRTLELRFGRDVFDAWLKSYFAHFAWHSITTEQMLRHLKANLFDAHPGKMGWNEVEEWVYEDGIPANAPLPDSVIFDAIDEAREAFLAGTLEAAALQADGWNTQEWMYFLDRLPEESPLAKIRALDDAWHLTGTPNAEIGMRWYRRAIRAGDTSVWDAADEHMTRIGRVYLTLPVYHAYARTPAGLPHAREVFARVRSHYHPLTQSSVQRMLDKAQGSA